MRIDATCQRTSFKAITTDDSFLSLASEATKTIVRQYQKADKLKKEPIGDRFEIVLGMHNLTEQIKVLTISKTRIAKNTIERMLEKKGGPDLESMEESSVTQESFGKRIDIMTGEEHRLKTQEQKKQKREQKDHEKWALI